jgi:hypothetical protein
MAASPRPLKPIDQLRAADLRAWPIWSFADDVEGEPGQDETSVEPMDVTHAPLWADSVFVAANFVASDGSKFIGLVDVTSDPDIQVHPCAIVTDATYAPLPRRGERMVESVLKFTEDELAAQLNR